MLLNTTFWRRGQPDIFSNANAIWNFLFFHCIVGEVPFSFLKTFGDNIIKYEVNYKKDSSSRKTKDYYETKINNFKDFYRKFTGH